MFLLCGLLLFASLASAQCTWQTADGSWHTGQPFGTALTDSSGVSINGVTAHSNCTPENNSGIEGTTGLEWQCVEFVRRYWYIVYSTPINLLSGMNADDFYSSAQGKASVNFGVSLLQYPNKTSTTPPQVGDILMSAGNGTAATKYGHVAIVSSVSSNQVCAVMQNWSETSRDGDGSHCMTMAVSSSQYTVNGFNNESPGQDSYPIQGWLRWQGAAGSGGAQAVMSNPTPGSTLTGASATFQWNNSGAAQYWLYVSKVGVGDSDLYNSSVGTGTSAAVNNLPTDGSTIYVRLYSELGSSWYYYDYTYKAYTASSGGLQVGKWVTVYDTNGLGLKLRTCASTSDSACPAILTMPDGTSMQITGGPVQATNYTWWNLSGYIGATYYSGWAVQDYIH